MQETRFTSTERKIIQTAGSLESTLVVPLLIHLISSQVRERVINLKRESRTKFNLIVKFKREK